MGCVLEKMDSNNVEVPERKDYVIDKEDKFIESSEKVSYYKPNLRIKIPKDKPYKRKEFD